MKSLYILLAGFSFFLISCSSSYRSTQTTDDVYYSPAMTNDNSYAKNNGNDEGDYVTVEDGDDVNSYSYRNDVQEEWYIRRGIRNPLYRNSFSLSLGLGGYYPYSYYDPFYMPLFTPYSYGYSELWNSFYNNYYNHGWMNYNPYSFGYYPYGGYYNHSPYYGYNGYPVGRVRDNGPRVINLSSPRTGISTPPRGNNPDRPILAPVRTMTNRNRNSTIERRVTPTNNNTNPSNSNRNVRKFNKNQRSNDTYRTTPSPNQNRRYTPPTRNNDVSPAPDRTFERSSSPSNPPSSNNNNSGNKSAPVRKF